MPPALAPVPLNRNPERADVDCIELIETLQEDLADPMMRRIALKSGAVSRGFVYNLRRRLFYNPRFALADVLGYDVYAFARVVVSGAAWAAEFSKTCRLEHETIAAFAETVEFPRSSVMAWCRGTHSPKLRTAMKLTESLGSEIKIATRM